MPKKKFGTVQIVTMLREVGVLLAKGDVLDYKMMETT